MGVCKWTQVCSRTSTGGYPGLGDLLFYIFQSYLKIHFGSWLKTSAGKREMWSISQMWSISHPRLITNDKSAKFHELVATANRLRRDVGHRRSTPRWQCAAAPALERCKAVTIFHA